MGKLFWETWLPDSQNLAWLQEFCLIARILPDRLIYVLVPTLILPRCQNFATLPEFCHVARTLPDCLICLKKEKVVYPYVQFHPRSNTTRVTITFYLCSSSGIFLWSPMLCSSKVWWEIKHFEVVFCNLPTAFSIIYNFAPTLHWYPNSFPTWPPWVYSLWTKNFLG